MANGVTELFGSKKGVAFTGTATALMTMVYNGAVPAILGGKLLVALSAVHIVSQAVVDVSKYISLKKIPEIPTDALDQETGL